jgi:hypothetical protein
VIVQNEKSPTNTTVEPLGDEEVRALNAPWTIKPNSRLARRLTLAGLITRCMGDCFRTPKGTAAVRAWIQKNV